MPAALAPAIDLDEVTVERVRLLADRTWSPGVGSIDLALACDECGNTVTSEGVAAEVGETRHHFCCDSCRSNFESRYEALRGGA